MASSKEVVLGEVLEGIAMRHDRSVLEKEEARKENKRAGLAKRNFQFPLVALNRTFTS